MTRQAEMVAAILTARSEDDIAGWLDRLTAALSAESTLQPDTVVELVARARPRWGVRSAADAAAYVAFWSHLTALHNLPALRGAYADVLYLLGPKTRAREALDVYLAAARSDPEVFIEYAGDFGDLATTLGAQLAFELAKISFYARRVDQGQMDEAELRDAVRELLAAHPDDPALREQLRAVAHRSFLG